MLYNRPPSGPAQTPGFTTPSTNSQTIAAMSAQGQPPLQTGTAGTTPVPSFPSAAPSGMSGSLNSSNAFQQSGSNASPSASPAGNMLTSQPPAMNSYFNSSNPSTLMRATVGNTTQSGAQ